MKASKELEKARKILGISKSATEDEVKRVYRALARKWHPDTNKTKKAHNKMQEINHAFQIIMEEEFGKIDPWEDYGKWWWKQFSNDPVWGNYVSEKDSGEDKNLISHHAKISEKEKKINVVNEFLNKRNTFAVVGASKNPKKYGNKVYYDLKRVGYRVYPINPRSKFIENDICYPSLGNLPIIPDVVIMVVPPKVAEKVVKEAYILGIRRIWMQPGSESDKAIAYCKKNGIRVLHDMCIIVKKKKLG